MNNGSGNSIGELESVHAQLKHINEDKKKFEAKKRELLDDIEAYMQETGTDRLTLSNGVVVELKTKKNKVALNKNELARILTIAFHGDHAKAVEVATFILKERAVKETTCVHLSEES